jgi:hypothetical protein
MLSEEVLLNPQCCCRRWYATKVGLNQGAIVMEGYARRNPLRQVIMPTESLTCLFVGGERSREGG